MADESLFDEVAKSVGGGSDMKKTGPTIDERELNVDHMLTYDPVRISMSRDEIFQDVWGWDDIVEGTLGFDEVAKQMAGEPVYNRTMRKFQDQMAESRPEPDISGINMSPNQGQKQAGIG